MRLKTCLTILVLCLVQSFAADESPSGPKKIETASGKVKSIDLIECSFVLTTGDEELTILTDTTTQFGPGAMLKEITNGDDVQCAVEKGDSTRKAIRVEILRSRQQERAPTPGTQQRETNN